MGCNSPLSPLIAPGHHSHVICQGMWDKPINVPLLKSNTVELYGDITLYKWNQWHILLFHLYSLGVKALLRLICRPALLECIWSYKG